MTDLSPLAACISLCELDCSSSGVVDISPLLACTKLLRLVVIRSRVTNASVLAGAFPNLQIEFKEDEEEDDEEGIAP